MTEEQFENKFKRLKRGEELVYHKGFHCVDHLGKRTGAARAAWDAYKRGKAVLYQRRIGQGVLEYCAKKVK